MPTEVIYVLAPAQSLHERRGNTPTHIHRRPLPCLLGHAFDSGRSLRYIRSPRLSPSPVRSIDGPWDVSADEPLRAVLAQWFSRSIGDPRAFVVDLPLPGGEASALPAGLARGGWSSDGRLFLAQGGRRAVDFQSFARSRPPRGRVLLRAMRHSQMLSEFLAVRVLGAAP